MPYFCGVCPYLQHELDQMTEELCGDEPLIVVAKPNRFALLNAYIDQRVNGWKYDRDRFNAYALELMHFSDNLPVANEESTWSGLIRTSARLHFRRALEDEKMVMESLQRRVDNARRTS
jgi:hypothetical protein